ncbi:unnamed protein product [Rotaria sp. Silwood2]|nr:unnamed protein product [Rotaria sp. Silwood2]CAF3981265.1 unnamed protein product [Rotaria sp. Silwood2]
MRQKKTLSRLDSFAVDGNAGFDVLQRIVQQLRVDDLEKKNLPQLIALSHSYLKAEFRQHVLQDDTNCGTHCSLFALSHPSDKNFQSDCHQSTNSMSCVQCNSLLILLCHMEDLIDMMESSNVKDEIKFDASMATEDIIS